MPKEVNDLCSLGTIWLGCYLMRYVGGANLDARAKRPVAQTIPVFISRSLMDNSLYLSGI